MTSDEGGDECTANVPVIIERQVVGTQRFVEVERETTDENGLFGMTLRGDGSANYVGHVEETARCGEASSPPQTVLVEKKVKLRVPGRRVDRGSRVKIVVRLAPCAGHEGDPAVLYKLVGGTLARVAARSGRATRDCKVTFRQTIRRNSGYQGRAPKSDADHLRGRSRKKAVRVRRR